MTDVSVTSQRSQTTGLTTEELCARALCVLGRLYRLMDADEPDLSANVSFAVGRQKLLRFGATQPGPVDADRGAAVVAFIEAVDMIEDARAAEAWFAWFSDDVLELLEHHHAVGFDRGGPPGRRYGDPEQYLPLGLVPGPRPPMTAPRPARGY